MKAHHCHVLLKLQSKKATCGPVQTGRIDVGTTETTGAAAMEGTAISVGQRLRVHFGRSRFVGRFGVGGRAHLAVEANGAVSGPRQVRVGAERCQAVWVAPRRCGEWSWNTSLFLQIRLSFNVYIECTQGYDRMSEIRPGAPTQCADSTASNAALAPQRLTVKLGKADSSSGQGWRQNGF